MSLDALSQILDAVKMRGAVYFHTHFSPPWGVRVPAYSNVARFHMAMRGSCWIRVDGVDVPVYLSTGDLIVIPHGASHIISDTPDGEALDVDQVIEKSGYKGYGALTYGGDDEERACKLFCGHFEFADGAVHPVLNALPGYIHIPNTQTLNANWLEAVMRFVSMEIFGEQPGSEAIVHRLSEIIFIQVIRAFVEEVGEDAGCLAAVLNPQFSKCLSRVHQEPNRQWTVESMATEAGMSRTIFAERFTALVGMTPLGYVTHWRMQLARRELLQTDRAIIDIAEHVGYGSEAAFNRAFKRQFDQTPGEMRRRSMH